MGQAKKAAPKAAPVPDPKAAKKAPDQPPPPPKPPEPAQRPQPRVAQARNPAPQPGQDAAEGIPPQPQPAERPELLGEALRANGGQRRPFAKPEKVLPQNQDDVLNNVLARELADPSPTPAGDTDDPNIGILNELAQGLSHGSDLNHVKDDVVRVASNQPEKIGVFQSVMRAIDLNRVNDFVQIRAHSEKEMKRAALRGDLKSWEHLALMRYSNDNIHQILASFKEGNGTTGVDSITLIEKVDFARQQHDAEVDKRYKNTTPQGREMIRKQIFVFKKKLQEAGKLKPNPNAT
jgi:hypothetical protein